jgi:hypothetical protein
MSSRPSADLDLAIVTPVWGERHIRRFLDLVLPSWLAPGNLPAIKGPGKIPFYILTRESDIPLFQQSSRFRSAQAFALPEFIAIDDLLGPDGVPVTLTLALTRGIARNIASGQRRAFALLNADFLLADGSLRTLKDAFDRGAEAVLAPSLRVIEEELEGELLLGVRDDVLTFQSRDLVKMAVRSLHPTVLASRVDQAIFSSANPHQIYWRPTPDLLIGRAFCMFALGVVVEGPVGQAASYCDYGFIEDLGVKSEPEVFGDSDRFLAIELAPLKQEQHFVQFSAPSASQVAEKLSVWTNRQHREQARHVILYKAADPPTDLEALTRSSDAFVEEVFARLGPAKPRLGHPNWLGGVGAWRVSRAYRGADADPPELADTPDIRIRAPGAALAPLRNLARITLFGDPGRRTMQHPYWWLEKAFQHRLKAMGGARLVVLGANASTQLLPVADSPHTPPEEADSAMVILDLASADRVDILLRRLSGVAPGTPAVLVALRTGEDDIGPLAITELVSRLDTDFLIDSLEPLDLRHDREVERRHARLADAAAVSLPVLGKLMLRSLFKAAGLFRKNAMIRLGMRPRPSGSTTAVLIACRRRAHAANNHQPREAHHNG